VAQLSEAAAASAGTKDKKSKDSNDKIFNDLLTVLGTDTLLMDFAHHLGRADCAVKTHGETKSRRPPVGFEGLFFDGAHWKGYDADGTVYDSYKMKLQVSGTNNYCQSFACYLWAKKGKLGDGLAADKYADNIGYMSLLWLGYFEKIMSSSAKPLKAWLTTTVGGSVALNSSISTLTRLTKEPSLASELSQSKE
jgi:hypothetical protein